MPKRRSARTGMICRAIAETLESRQLLSSTFYTITDVGTLPGGVSSTATAINASGTVVGFSDTDGTNNHDHAFLYTSLGGIQDLGTLPGDTSSFAEGINDIGNVVGYSVDSQNNEHAFLWTPANGMTALSPLVAGGSSHAAGINNAGMIVGEASIANGDDHAVVWSAGGAVQDIGTLGGPDSFATAINGNGDVVGAADLASTHEHGFLWTSASGMQDLGTLGSDPDSVAYSINGSGQIAGQSVNVDADTSLAFIYTGGALHALADLGANTGGANGINSSGQVVGFDQDPRSQFIDASLWDTSLALTDLNSKIPPSSGWGLDEARGLNDGGQIVGYGASPTGQQHGFVVNPASGPPGAVVFAPDLSTVGGTETVTVIYYSNTSTIDTSTIDGSNITITGPGGITLSAAVAGTPTMSDGLVTALYAVNPPGGSWDVPDSGTYTVSVVPGSVKDANGAGVTSDTTTFDVNFEIDSSFATTTNNAVPLAFSVEQVLQEQDGNILSIGHRIDNNGAAEGILESFMPSGDLDTAFGANGIVSATGGQNEAFYAAAVQSSDGKIVAVGGSDGKFFVARYKPNGAIDTTFGNAGVANADFGADEPATASEVLIESDGSILVGGDANGKFALARFTSTGALDATFNPGGADDPAFPAGGQRIVTTGSVSMMSGLILQSDNKILGVGNSGTGATVFRLNSDGSNDSTFGTSGIAALPQLAAQGSDNQTNLEGMGIQPGGDILVSGQAAGGGFGVVRLTSAGQVDSTFTGGGFESVGFSGTNERADDVVVNPIDGTFILIGTSQISGNIQTAIVAFNADGTLNTHYGLNGKSLLSGATSRSTAAGAGNAQSFHPQLIDASKGMIQSDGNVVINNINAGNSSVRRVLAFSENTPGSPPVQFGRVGRKNIRLAPFALTNGTTVTVSLAGGASGLISHFGNQITLTLTGNSSLSIRTRGGANAINLAGVTVNGKLLSLSAPTATVIGTLTTSTSAGNITLAGVTGTLKVAGNINNLSVGALSGSASAGGAIHVARIGALTGTLAAGASFNSITLGSASGAKILAGTNLGADGRLGGVGANADTYAGGQIFNLRVTGAVANSFIGAGVDPVDGIFGNQNDIAVAGQFSDIRAVTVRGGIDATTVFEATAFPRYAHIPGKDSPIADSHFILL